MEVNPSVKHRDVIAKAIFVRKSLSKQNKNYKQWEILYFSKFILNLQALVQ